MNYLCNFLHFHLICFWEHFTPKLYSIRSHMYLGLNQFCQFSAMRFQAFPAERVQNRIHRNFP